MRRLLSCAVLLLSVAALSPSVNALVDTADTKLLTQPAISARNVAFIYAGDLFVADVDASANVTNVRRLTTDDGVESNPSFSKADNSKTFLAAAVI